MFADVWFVYYGDGAFYDVVDPAFGLERLYRRGEKVIFSFFQAKTKSHNMHIMHNPL